MSVLSITAPQFTAEDELLEQETYTEEEIEAAERDVFGQHIPEEERPVLMEDLSEEDLDLALRRFHVCMEEMPDDEKDAYLEAMGRVPHLVELESHPFAFLKAEEFQAYPAAERCMNYWELRRWLFGERAWLPMTATGNGTLHETDIQLLRTGFCSLLQDDEHGRGVVCFQVTPKKLDYDRIAMVRVIFYMLTVAMERPNVQRNGIVVVADTKNYTTSRFDRKLIKFVAYLFTGHYHPVTTRAIHITAPPGKKSCFVLVLPFIRYFMTRQIRQRFLLHAGTTPECALDLQEYGVLKKHLPEAMGGDFTLAEFLAWVDQRRIVEEAREEDIFGEDLPDDDDDLASHLRVLTTDPNLSSTELSGASL